MDDTGLKARNLYGTAAELSEANLAPVCENTIDTIAFTAPWEFFCKWRILPSLAIPRRQNRLCG
jgi:hypothetical protein